MALAALRHDAYLTAPRALATAPPLSLSNSSDREVMENESSPQCGRALFHPRLGHSITREDQLDLVVIVIEKPLHRRTRTRLVCLTSTNFSQRERKRTERGVSLYWTALINGER
jgi:hypothetical protein